MLSFAPPCLAWTCTIAPTYTILWKYHHLANCANFMCMVSGVSFFSLLRSWIFCIRPLWICDIKYVGSNGFTWTYRPMVEEPTKSCREVVSGWLGFGPQHYCPFLESFHDTITKCVLNQCAFHPFWSGSPQNH
jgi:hypothetical protein